MLTVTSEGDYGGLFFSADIPPAEQEGLAHEIEAFDHASIDRQFSCGQWDGRPVGATGCEAFVEKRWHQEPHFTVQLRFRMQGGWYRKYAGAHVYLDVSETILVDNVVYFWQQGWEGRWENLEVSFVFD